MEQIITNEALFQKLMDVEALLQNKQDRFAHITDSSVELWTAHDIADYFQFSYDHTMRAIIADPAFPEPVTTAGQTGGKSNRRYISGDVVKFCRKRQRR